MRAIQAQWLVVFVVLLAGCHKIPDSSAEKTYDVTAKVVSVDIDNKVVTLDHQDIPGLMKAMEMKFHVQDAKVLDGIKAGDDVRGKLKVKSGDYTLTELHKR